MRLQEGLVSKRGGNGAPPPTASHNFIFFYSKESQSLVACHMFHWPRILDHPIHQDLSEINAGLNTAIQIREGLTISQDAGT